MAQRMSDTRKAFRSLSGATNLASKKRKRARRACNRCHERKVRCDVAFVAPPCTNCRLDGVSCEVYNPTVHPLLPSKSTSPSAQVPAPTQQSLSTASGGSIREISSQDLHLSGSPDGSSLASVDDIEPELGEYTQSSQPTSHLHTCARSSESVCQSYYSLLHFMSELADFHSLQ